MPSHRQGPGPMQGVHAEHYCFRSLAAKADPSNTRVETPLSFKQSWSCLTVMPSKVLVDVDDITEFRLIKKTLFQVK